MKNFTARITAITLSAMLFFGTLAPINAFAEETAAADQAAATTQQANITAAATTATKAATTKTTKTVKTYTGTASRKLPVRKSKSDYAKRIKTYKKGAKVTLLSVGSKWVKVKVGSKVGYARGEWINYLYGTAYKPYQNVVTGKVSCKKLAIRSAKSTSAKVLIVAKKGAKLKVLTPGNKWVKVQYSNVTGYVKGQNVTVGSGSGAVKASSSYALYVGNGGTGAAVARLGLRYVGGRYVWGGSTLGKGVDCSGFIMALYRRFGKSLPHSSSAMRHCGRSVGGIKHARPGDIVCYGGHVALYIGGGKVVHASNPKNGIKVSKANYRSIITVRRIF